MDIPMLDGLMTKNKGHICKYKYKGARAQQSSYKQMVRREA